MIILPILYTLFLAFYLPLNFYIIFRAHQMKLIKDRTDTAISFLAVSIGVVVLISLITIAVFSWSGPFNLLESL